jgi:RNA polymerase sigma-70 factor (ECF subfamily)
LVRRAQDGDTAAFGELIARHRHSALRVAAVVLGSETEADDVVQDAALRTWRAMASFDGAREFRPWFLRAVANTARNARRSRTRRSALAVRAGERRGPDQATPEERAVTDAERSRVVAALNRLEADDRLVLGLRHFEQLTEAEMAVVLDCPPGTVKSRLSRATARLRSRLADGGGHDD